MLIPALQSISSVAFERILYCLAEGSLLAVVVTFSIRLLDSKSSRTKFVVWFSTMVATALLPLVDLQWSGQAGGTISSRAVITLPFAVAFYASLVWLALAGFGLLRVCWALWQLHGLRNNSIELPLEELPAEIQHFVTEFRKYRSVSILVSQQVQVPTAVGFFKSAVILPAWMLEDVGSEELKHVILHELAHLRRRDDWTNFIQKIVKALLFFHPGVWWMERQLSLQREMACDDSVLEHTGSPRAYAECLARVAEKNFMRRQIALAQAAVSRVRQLSLRVSRILDPKRCSSTQSWRPAVPGVIVLALVSGVSLSCAPDLVRVGDATPAPAATAPTSVARGQLASTSSTPFANTNSTLSEHAPEVRAWPAALKETPANEFKPKSHLVPARHVETRRTADVPRTAQMKAKSLQRPPVILARYGQRPAQTHPVNQPTNNFVLVIETRQTLTAGANGWQLSVQQLRWLVPVRQIQKQVPSKT